MESVVLTDKATNGMLKNAGSLLVANPIIQILINVAVCVKAKRVLETKKPFLIPVTWSGF